MRERSGIRSIFAVCALALTVTPVIQATTITVDATHTTFTFRNSAAAFADDLDIVLLTATGPRIDLNGSSGGPHFPGKAGFGPPGFGNAATEVRFIGDVTQHLGVPGQGTFDMSFPGWPAGTKFDIKFSYSQLGDLKVDVNVVAAGAFRNVPAFALPVAGVVPEPSTATMAFVSLGLLAAIFLYRGPYKYR